VVQGSLTNALGGRPSPRHRPVPTRPSLTPTCDFASVYELRIFLDSPSVEILPRAFSRSSIRFCPLVFFFSLLDFLIHSEFCFDFFFYLPICIWDRGNMCDHFQKRISIFSAVGKKVEGYKICCVETSPKKLTIFATFSRNRTKRFPIFFFEDIITSLKHVCDFDDSKKLLGVSPKIDQFPPENFKENTQIYTLSKSVLPNFLFGKSPPHLRTSSVLSRICVILMTRKNSLPPRAGKRTNFPTYNFFYKTDQL